MIAVCICSIIGSTLKIRKLSQKTVSSFSPVEKKKQDSAIYLNYQFCLRIDWFAKPLKLLGLRKIFTCQRAFCKGLCPNSYIITGFKIAGIVITYPLVGRVSQYHQGSFKGQFITNKCCFGMITGWRKYHSRDSEKSR